VQLWAHRVDGPPESHRPEFPIVPRVWGLAAACGPPFPRVSERVRQAPTRLVYNELERRSRLLN